MEYPADVMQARELLQGLLQLEPGSTRGLGMLGTLEWKAGKRKLARQYLVAGIKADPSHIANLHTLARLELEEGHLQEARELFAQGQQLEPSNAYVLQVGCFLGCDSPSSLSFFCFFFFFFLFFFFVKLSILL